MTAGGGRKQNQRRGSGESNDDRWGNIVPATTGMGTPASPDCYDKNPKKVRERRGSTTGVRSPRWLTRQSIPLEFTLCGEKVLGFGNVMLDIKSLFIPSYDMKIN